MKAWTAAVALLALGSAAVTAGLVGARAGGRVGLSAALALAEQTPSAQLAPATPRPASAAMAPVVPAGATPVTPESLPKIVSLRRTATYNGAPVYVPEACSGAYDVVLHFHGAHPYVKDLFERANVDAVIAVFNSGNGAERYAQAFQAVGTLTSLLRQVQMAATPLCPGAAAKPRRIALTAWSAGYGAVEKLLARPEDRERVDAVLLADGLHAGFVDRWKRTLAPNALQAFRDFGELAKRDHKLFSVTHSSIVTHAYASTTECSRLLLQKLNVPSEPGSVSGQAGSFSVIGSQGADKAAHIAQFRQMDTTLLHKLRERWAARP